MRYGDEAAGAAADAAKQATTELAEQVNLAPHALGRGLVVAADARRLEQHGRAVRRLAQQQAAPAARRQEVPRRDEGHGELSAGSRHGYVE